MSLRHDEAGLDQLAVDPIATRAIECERRWAGRWRRGKPVEPLGAALGILGIVEPHDGMHRRAVDRRAVVAGERHARRDVRGEAGMDHQR
ncbi:MAG: hypothetical protein E6J90_51325 [Deltaproteobacteria bacterium]|nr:MAG: hypothetical protein E6J90_51325 [Deltaproteobacteria bacterium]TMQ09628.1 MAG: hypothetical protein E6J91_29690 [Deltaproteobacteria bacterium]